MHEEPEEQAHFLRRVVSLGDLITLVGSLLALGIAYGQLSQRIDNVSDDVQILQGTTRTMTPGAAQSIAAITAHDNAQDQQLIALREDIRQQRAEIISELRELNAKLDKHMDNSHR